jgi:phosphatidylglycerophosphate synthase
VTKALAIVIATRPQAALRRVAGLSLLERAVRTAAASGREVVVTADDAGVMSALGNVAGARFEPPAQLAAQLAAQGGSATVWLAHYVYDRRAAAALDEYAAGHTDGGMGPALLLARAPLAAEIIGASDREAALCAALGAGPQVAEQGTPSIDAGSDAGARAAEAALWQSCRKPIDGYVSRNLNRYISLAISRRIVDTRITPNHVSALCIGLGLLSGVLAAHGGYAYLLAGATLFKINSILDGVDGELARVRWAYSKIGELLDSAGDNIANFSFFGGVTIAALRAGQNGLANAGLIALSLWALYLVFLYTRLSGSGRGDVMTVRTNLDTMRSPLVREALALGRKVLRRDSFVMISFVAALFGYAPYLLLMMLAGSSVVFAYAVLHFAARWLRPAETLEVDSR